MYCCVDAIKEVPFCKLNFQINMIKGANILVTGCSRGLGLEMVKQLTALKTGKIIASCRVPEKANELCEIASQNKNVIVTKLDVTDLDSFKDLSVDINRICNTEGLNILINNAGISPKSTRINLVTADQMTETFFCNVVAPLMLTKALIPALGQGAAASGKNSVVANLSSILGSIEENTKQGGLYPYRSSKSALNSVTKSLSIDLASLKIGAISIHPGWVQTDMGGKHAPLTAPESIDGVLKVIDNFNDSLNGGFYNNFGEKLPW